MVRMGFMDGLVAGDDVGFGVGDAWGWGKFDCSKRSVFLPARDPAIMSHRPVGGWNACSLRPLRSMLQIPLNSSPTAI